MAPNYRRCLSCQKIDQKQTFWRIVRVYPTNLVQLDVGIGRSAYLCPQADCLRTAQKKNRLGRSLKADVPEVIYQTLWERLATQTAQDKQPKVETKLCPESTKGILVPTPITSLNQQ